MRILLQRTTNASVSVEEKVTGKIKEGFVALVGVTHEDTEEDVEYLVNKVVHLRVFEDKNGKMNLTLQDIKGSILSISQFTLYADTRKGRRPNFMQAAKPDKAQKLYELFNDKLKEQGIHTETGKFAHTMNVQLTNNGPVTLMLDSETRK